MLLANENGEGVLAVDLMKQAQLLSGRAASQLADATRRELEDLRHFFLRKTSANGSIDLQISDLAITLFVIRITERVKNLNLGLQASYFSLQFTHAVVGYIVAHDIIPLFEDGWVCLSPHGSA